MKRTEVSFALFQTGSQSHNEKNTIMNSVIIVKSLLMKGGCGSGDVVQSGITTVMNIMSSVVNGEEDQEMHGSQINQQETN
jgi:hypothetical protein